MKGPHRDAVVATTLALQRITQGVAFDPKNEAARVVAAAASRAAEGRKATMTMRSLPPGSPFFPFNRPGPHQTKGIAMKHWIIEQTATGVILFDGEAASREDAFERYAQDGGYESYDQLRRLTGPSLKTSIMRNAGGKTRNPSKPTRCPLMNTRCLRIRSIDD